MLSTQNAFLARLLTVSLMLIVVTGVSGQDYDPETGELIVIESDSLISAPGVLKFDPETGEFIMPATETPTAPSKTVRVPQFDPMTGLPFASGNTINACFQARLDAKKEASPFWYAGGVIYFVGLPAVLLVQPNPAPENMANKSVQEIFEYTKCYRSESYKERFKRMGLGCVGYLALVILLSS